MQHFDQMVQQYNGIYIWQKPVCSLFCQSHLQIQKVNINNLNSTIAVAGLDVGLPLTPHTVSIVNCIWYSYARILNSPTFSVEILLHATNDNYSFNLNDLRRSAELYNVWLYPDYILCCSEISSWEADLAAWSVALVSDQQSCISVMSCVCQYS